MAGEPEHDIRILSDDLVVEIKDPTHWQSREKLSKQILTYAGKKDHSELKISFNPAWETVELVSAHIVNLADWRAVYPSTDHFAYTLTKAALVTMTKSLALALAPNIQVNAILPGWIDTALTRQARKDISGLNEKVLARTPSSRWGEPRELGGAAVFLASPASDFITGVALPVDGGFSSNIL